MRHLKGAGHVCAPWGHWHGTPLQLSRKLWSESELEARYNWIYINTATTLFGSCATVCVSGEGSLAKEGGRKKKRGTVCSSGILPFHFLESGWLSPLFS